MKRKQNVFDRFVAWLDHTQAKNRFLAFPYAVVKKYGDDEANYQAALIAFYGFLSLFPILIVLTAIAQKISINDYDFQQRILNGVASYFPALGPSLAESIQSPSKAGLALVFGLFLMVYGARGVADAVQHALNHAWGIARYKRAGFPKNMFKSFGILFGGGFGLLVAAIISGFATAQGQTFVLRFGLGLLSLIVLYIVFWAVFTYGASTKHGTRTNLDGALFATVGLQILQLAGAYIINHQLKTQTGLNAQIAVILAVLFWLYLQARVLLYAIEINVVRYHRLHPRAIRNDHPLPADKKAFELYKQREKFIEE